MAEITFPHNAALDVVLRNPVRTVPSAIATSDTSVRIVQNDTSFPILRVGIYRAPLKTGRLEAMIAPHGEVEPLGEWIGAALDLADTPPVDFKGVTVLLRASHLTASAANTAGHVEVKTVLFPSYRCA
jgi:hypothetical protein